MGIFRVDKTVQASDAGKKETAFKFDVKTTNFLNPQTWVEKILKAAP